MQAVIEGDAVGLVEQAMIANDLSQGKLVRLFDIGVRLAQDYAYHLVYPETSSQDPRILAFREWMLDEAGQPAAAV